MIHTIVSITGASCAGKTILAKRLLEHFGGGRVRTITTRNPRPDETDADYDFQNEESLAGRGDLLWVQPVHNAVYAVATTEFDKAAYETGGLAFIVITPDRHESISEHFAPKGVRCVAVHLTHPGDVEVRRRLQTRGATEEDIEKRLVDSAKYEKIASEVRNLTVIPPGTPEEVFINVLQLIKPVP